MYKRHPTTGLFPFTLKPFILIHLNISDIGATQPKVTASHLAVLSYNRRLPPSCWMMHSPMGVVSVLLPAAALLLCSRVPAATMAVWHWRCWYHCCSERPCGTPNRMAAVFPASCNSCSSRTSFSLTYKILTIENAWLQQWTISSIERSKDCLRELHNTNEHPSFSIPTQKSIAIQ